MVINGEPRHAVYLLLPYFYGVVTLFEYAF